MCYAILYLKKQTDWIALGLLDSRLFVILQDCLFYHEVFSVYSSLCLIAHPLGGSNSVHLGRTCF